jgi:hypothetical protein
VRSRWREAVRLADGDESLAEDVAYIFELGRAVAHEDGTITLSTPSGREARLPRERAVKVILARWGDDDR